MAQKGKAPLLFGMEEWLDEDGKDVHETFASFSEEKAS